MPQNIPKYAKANKNVECPLNGRYLFPVMGLLKKATMHFNIDRNAPAYRSLQRDYRILNHKISFKRTFRTFKSCVKSISLSKIYGIRNIKALNPIITKNHFTLIPGCSIIQIKTTDKRSNKSQCELSFQQKVDKID